MTFKLTAEMAQRYENYGTGWSAPCVICGGSFPKCGHQDDTPDVCSRLKALGAEGRAKLPLDADVAHQPTIPQIMINWEERKVWCQSCSRWIAHEDLLITGKHVLEGRDGPSYHRVWERN